MAQTPNDLLRLHPEIATEDNLKMLTTIEHYANPASGNATRRQRNAGEVANAAQHLKVPASWPFHQHPQQMYMFLMQLRRSIERYMIMERVGVKPNTAVVLNGRPGVWIVTDIHPDFTLKVQGLKKAVSPLRLVSLAEA